MVGYDHETGFGLLRTLEPPKIKPLALGRSADVKAQDPALVASYGGAGAVLPVHVASRREFTGSWEYLVEDAIFTSPPHPAWSGAALINREGKLVGVGSLIVGDANGEDEPSPGNMFVPIDLLPPILGDLLAKGRIAGPGRPWLGVNAQAAAGPAAGRPCRAGRSRGKAGLQRGDIIVGINGEKTANAVGALPQDVGARRRRRDGAARREVGRHDAPRRGEVGQPARHAQARHRRISNQSERAYPSPFTGRVAPKAPGGDAAHANLSPPARARYRSARSTLPEDGEG